MEPLRAAGAELVVIGNGTPEQAKAFRDERDVRIPLFVDPRLRAYSAAGLRRSVGAAVNLRTIVNAARTVGKGHMQGATHGDPWQLGGAFVVLPGGQVVYEQRSDVAGDHVKPEELLAAVRRVSA